MANRDYIVLGQIDNQDLKLGEVRAVSLPPESEELVVKSKEIVQVFEPEKGIYYRKVIVDAVALDKPDQSKTTIPTKERQVIKADLGYELAENIVEPIPYMYADITNVDATAEDVLNGKIFVDNQGNEVQGTAELKEDLDAELTSQEEAITNLETAVDRLPEPKMDMLQARVDATNSCNYLFYNYTGDNLDFAEKLDTSNATSAVGMFSGSTYLTRSLPFNLSNVTNANELYYDCQNLLEVPNHNLSKVTALQKAFYYCKKITTLTLDLTNCRYASNLCYMCSGLTTLNLLNTENLEDCSSIISGCSKLTSIVLNIPKSKSISALFQNCKNLKTIEVRFSPTASINMYGGEFNGCSALENLRAYNIRQNLAIGSGTSWGHLLTDESIINTAKELWDLTGSSSKKLTVSTPSDVRFDVIYVKLVDVTDEMRAEDEYIDNKKPCVVCESTDDGAMTLREYVISKNWTLAK